VKKPFVIALLIVTAVPLLIAVAALPPHGAIDTPVHSGISSRYLEQGEEEAGAANIVTGVILNYRGLDTAGEVTVIFTALAAVFAVLVPVVVRSEKTVHTAPSPVVRFVVRLLAPFVALFAVYVIAHGHSSPGGGFQGGAILGGLFVALAMVLGVERARRMVPDAAGVWLRAAAPMAFVAVGVVGLTLTGVFLGYPRTEELHAVREAMLLALEVGIAVGGAAIFAAIFCEMEGQ
jgi:multicomponent Na+:H+ antiporter subunit B